jgi:hypothetical protein
MSRTLLSKAFAGLAFVTGATTASVAAAEPPPPVDVVLRDAPPPHRSVALEWSPLALIIGKISVNAIFVPGEHHALVVSPFYTQTTTAPINVVDASGGPNTRLPAQKFEGFGGEIGYRYYWGHGGPRGLFVGPSLLVSWMTATAENGSQTSFAQYGLAADVGYQMLVTDAVSISIGGGLQYALTSQSIPNQQFPADVFANGGLRPRLLLSFGWAF